MHFANNNPKNAFLLDGHILGTVDEERDLGVMICNGLKASSQFIKVVKTANQLLGMIKRTLPIKQKKTYFSTQIPGKITQNNVCRRGSRI